MFYAQKYFVVFQTSFCYREKNTVDTDTSAEMSAESQRTGILGILDHRFTAPANNIVSSFSQRSYSMQCMRQKSS